MSAPILLRITIHTANADDTNEVIKALHGLSDIMKARNPGVLVYHFYRQHDTQIDLTEVYSNSQSFVAHLAHDDAKVLLDVLVSKSTKITSQSWSEEYSDEAKKELDDFGAEYLQTSAGYIVHPHADVKSNV